MAILEIYTYCQNIIADAGLRMLSVQRLIASSYMYDCAPTGIIIVPLPKKAHTPPLSESRSHAVERFLSEAPLG